MNSNIKGDWYQRLLEDFKFLDEVKNDQEIITQVKWPTKRKYIQK